MKKKTPKQLLAKQKKWWKEQVRSNWNNTCAKCGKSDGKLDTHHLFYGKELRWYDPIVGVLLCVRCHKFSDSSAHRGGLLFYSWFFTEHKELSNKILDKIKGL